ncbi:MAG: CHAT domain-containing protein [Deltaproteobacteria bacterium]|nr:CHAT domain-containing protein [Deltaproteobacteria bacterium]
MTRRRDIRSAPAAAAFLAVLLFSAAAAAPVSARQDPRPDTGKLAAELQRSVRDLGPDAPETLRRKNALAIALGEVGDFAAAEEMFGQVAEQRSRSLGPEHRDTLQAFADRAYYLDELGDYVAARDLYSRVLESLSRSFGPDDEMALAVKNNLAFVLTNLGEVAGARDMFLEVLAAQELLLGKAHRMTLSTRVNLAYTLGVAGDYVHAREEYVAILEAFDRDLGAEHPVTLTVRNNLAHTLGRLDMGAEALAMFGSVLEARERTLGFDHPATLSTRHNLAVAMDKAGDFEGARALLMSALESETRRYGPDPVMSAITAHSLGWILAARGETAQAIFFLKLAVSAAQTTRSTVDASDEATRRSYIATVAQRYQLLFDQLLKAGRREEALAVLELLKEDELSELDSAALRAGASRSPASPGAVSLSVSPPGSGSRTMDPDGSPGVAPPDLFAGTPEEAARKLFLAAAASGAALEAERAAQSEDGGGAGPEGGQGGSAAARLFEIEARAAAARTAFLEATERLPGLAGDAAAAPGTSERLASLQARLAQAGGGTVLVYAVSAPETLHLVMVTADKVVTRESPCATADLQRMAMDFRATVQNRFKDPRPAGKALYDVLLKPVEADLRAAGARTLTLSLDGALRYVPLAALYDGEKYLVERYPISIFTRSTASGPGPAASWDGASARAMGVTAAWPGYSALPGVAVEIAGIVGSGDTEGVLRGEGYLDAAFDRATLAGSLASDAPVVHIASHFSLDPASLDRTGLLLGDGSRLSLSELRSSSDFDFTGLDILGLSACDTGSGARKAEDGREVESLGELFQRAGASAVLATLLRVDDGSTPIVMREFYRLRYVEGKDKAESLRGAQLLVMNDGKESAAVQRGTALVAEGRAGAAAEAAPPWEGTGKSHPFYWSPYVIIGDWR